jgi:hypothetical protein
MWEVVATRKLCSVNRLRILQTQKANQQAHHDIEVDTVTGKFSINCYDGFITTQVKVGFYIGKTIVARLHQ